MMKGELKNRAERFKGMYLELLVLRVSGPFFPFRYLPNVWSFVFVLPSIEVCVRVRVCICVCSLALRMVDVHEEDQQTITVQVEVKRETEDEEEKEEIVMEEKAEFQIETECVISCTPHYTCHCTFVTHIVRSVNSLEFGLEHNPLSVLTT